MSRVSKAFICFGTFCGVVNVANAETVAGQVFWTVLGTLTLYALVTE